MPQVVRKGGALTKEAISDGDIKLLFESYNGFYDEAVTLADVLEQWGDIKTEIAGSTGLLSRKFIDLWAGMLVQYTDESPLVLKLVVITLLLPCDTSECERIFSLMNDLKTAERNRLNQENLKNLMLWHIMGYTMGADGKKEKMKSHDVPVMAILKEFRAMADGTHGRKPHHPAEVPKYEYEKLRAPVKVE